MPSVIEAIDCHNRRSLLSVEQVVDELATWGIVIHSIAFSEDGLKKQADPTLWLMENCAPESSLCRNTDHYAAYLTNDIQKVTCQQCLEWLHA